jgi:hypothetical protein
VYTARIGCGEFETAIVSVGDGLVLVAHSLGCLATVWWAASGFAVQGRIHAAMLVAPRIFPPLRGSARTIQLHAASRLAVAVSVLVVASETDPFASIEAASAMAAAWESAFLNIGRASIQATATGSKGSVTWNIFSTLSIFPVSSLRRPLHCCQPAGSSFSPHFSHTFYYGAR